MASLEDLKYEIASDMDDYYRAYHRAEMKAINCDRMGGSRAAQYAADEAAEELCERLTSKWAERVSSLQRQLDGARAQIQAIKAAANATRV